MKRKTKREKERENQKYSNFYGNRKLLKDEKILKKLFIYANDAIAIIDHKTGIIIEGNKKFLELTGCSLKEAIGLHHLQIYPRNERRAYSGLFEKLFLMDSFILDNISIERKDGIKIPVELSASVVEIEGRKILKGIFRNVEERKKVERLLFEKQEELSEKVENNVFELAKAIKVFQEEFRRRKEVEKKYEDLNLQYKLILNYAGEGICGLDKNGDITFINPAGARMLGWTVEELEGKKIWKVFHKIDNHQKFINWNSSPINRTLLEGKSYHIENEFFERKDGSIFPVDYLSNPIIEKGRITGAVLIFRDISKQKIAEEELKLTHAMLNNVADTTCLIGRDGEFKYVNNAFCKSLGYRREEMLSMKVSDIDPLFPQEIWDEHWENVKRKGNLTFESVHKRKDGKIFPVEISVSFLKYDEKEFIIAFARNIEFRKKSLEALKESESKFRSVTQTASDGIVSIDSCGKIVSWNSGAEKIFGYKENEIVGKSLERIIPKRLYKKFKEGFDYIIESKDFSFLEKPIELTGLRKNGKEFPLELSLGSWYANGQIFFSAVIRDITFRKEYEKEVKMHAARAESLVRAASNLNSCIEYEKVLNTVCKEVAESLKAHSVSVFLYDEINDVFYNSKSLGIPSVYSEQIKPLPGKRYRELFNKNELVFMTNSSKGIEKFVNGKLFQLLNIKTVAVAGMLRENKIVGLIKVFWNEKDVNFNRNEFELLKGLAHLSALALSNSIYFKNSLSHIEKLQALHDIDNAIATNADFNSTLDIILNSLVNHLKVDAADILILEDDVTLSCVASIGFGRDMGSKISLQNIDYRISRIFETGKSVFITRIQDYPKEDFSFLHCNSEKISSYCAIPFFVKGEIKGILEVFTKKFCEESIEWISYLETIAEQIAIAIDNWNLLNELKVSNIELANAYDTTLEGWSKALDLRDRETEGHTQRVSDLTIKLALAFNISGEDLVHIRRGALLHDIGKMAIPDSILLKPAKLTEKEWEIMKRHPVFAYELLAPIKYLKNCIEIPYCHHERWDGNGYPRGLKKEEIPFPARIFAVVDIWDALCSDRPYRPAWEENRVIEYIREISGTHLDPEIVKKFLELIEQER
ncbi:MAG: PAS domain S-box protein [Candidatus Schekmanbacteria bacterium]|nr:MAG: PAS domain S-box protein [Candidatus Schekmanbacteria bacterium]